MAILTLVTNRTHKIVLNYPRDLNSRHLKFKISQKNSTYKVATLSLSFYVVSEITESFSP